MGEELTVNQKRYSF